MHTHSHTHSRRGFLSYFLGAAWTGASVLEQAFFRAAQARAQAPEAPANLFDIDKVADGIYAAIARPASFTNCNAAIFENSGDLLIVDTHSKPSAAAALAAQVRKEVSPKPVRYIVNTHFHWDHTQGTPEYKRMAPGATVIASTATRNLLAEFGAARLKSSLEELPKQIAETEQLLAEASTPQEQALHERRLRDARAYLAEMRDYTPELPALAFDRGLVLHDKANELQLSFRGRGHTAGDIVVFCPEKKVVATGDLLHGFLPFIGDGYPREWPGTLRAAGELPFEAVIGGHGDVQRTRQRLYEMAAYIEELAGLVEKGKREGRTVEELQQEITPAALRSLTAGGYGAFVTASLMKYNANSAQGSPAQVLAGGVRDNIAAAFQALERT
jgi:glyoxylase-like metal-dependent hydrolase (beta-lactamase superfamily II)